MKDLTKLEYVAGSKSDPKFYNKDGSLTAYSLACGYVEKKREAQLWREHECYHILTWVDGKVVREATDSLTEARKHLRRLAKIGQPYKAGW